MDDRASSASPPTNIRSSFRNRPPSVSSASSSFRHRQQQQDAHTPPSPSPAQQDSDTHTDTDTNPDTHADTESKDNEIPEEPEPEEKPTLAASVVLTTLPRDAAGALDKYARAPPRKVEIRFRPIGSAPRLTRAVAKISSSQHFEVVVRFLRRQLRFSDQEPLFVYINSSFAPSLDQEVGFLHECFKVDGHLQVSYCNTAAFG
ncbi:ubiquitin-like autophagy protein Apg12-domain-containing protein [Myxozyma melibiosi]|uniref:Ubiquitin-like protein ATG12 n=1 Tax=Myxozyma melibiosi TaxID=54550 RepID=A0ABR1FD61_9ASCO